MIALVAAGERIGVDGTVLDGTSELDTSLITGETVPATVGPGDRVFAGTLNLDAPLQLEVAAVGEGTLLAEIVRLMELAEQRRARYVVLADRVAGLYAPAVHGLALATFLGWTLLAGTAWQAALLYAVAVLIITCPCALGLAVPAVQVIASGSSAAPGRAAEVGDRARAPRSGRHRGVRQDRHADPRTTGAGALGAARSRGAADGRLARRRQPSSAGAGAGGRRAGGGAGARGVEEVPGRGLRLATPMGEIRLGSRAWCGIEDAGTIGRRRRSSGWRGRGRPPVRFAFDDPLRADAAAGDRRMLRARGLAVELLSGDRAPAVAAVAAAARHRELARRLQRRPTRPPASRRWRRPDVAC